MPMYCRPILWATAQVVPQLDKYNQKYIDKLNAIKRGHGTAKTIEQLYDEITKHAFLNYDVESEKLLASKKGRLF
jgi:hypothetical protein